MSHSFFKTPFVVKRVLNQAQAQAVLKRVERLPHQPAAMYHTEKGVHLSARRKSQVGWIRTGKLSDMLFHEVRSINQKHWKIAKNLYRSPIQTSLYLKGGHLDWHVDGPFKRDGKSTIRHDRLLTAVVLLSDPNDFSGGQFELTDFYGTKYEIRLRQGEMVVFPSEYFHRVRKILAGKRRTLTLWARGRRATIDIP